MLPILLTWLAYNLFNLCGLQIVKTYLNSLRWVVLTQVLPGGRLSHKLSEGSRLLVQDLGADLLQSNLPRVIRSKETYSMALLKTLLPIVPKLIHERHILIQFLLREIGHARLRQVPLIRILIHAHEPRSLPCLSLDSRKRLRHLLRRVVVGRGEDSLPEHLLPLQDHSFDELPRVVCGGEEGDGGCGRRGEGEGVGVRGGPHHAFDVGHVEAGHEEGGGDAEGADVGLDVGFAVEMVDAGVFAVAEFSDVEEGGLDEVLDADFLG